MGTFSIKAEAYSSSDTLEDEYETDVWVRYVRRELRGLDNADRELFLGAMNTIFTMDCSEGETKYGDGRVTELLVDGVRIVTAWACHLCRLFCMGQNETLRVTAAIATPAGGAPAAPAAAARHNSCSDQGPTTGASGPCTLSRTRLD